MERCVAGTFAYWTVVRQWHDHFRMWIFDGDPNTDWTRRRHNPSAIQSDWASRTLNPHGQRNGTERNGHWRRWRRQYLGSNHQWGPSSRKGLLSLQCDSLLPGSHDCGVVSVQDFKTELADCILPFLPSSCMRFREWCLTRPDLLLLLLPDGSVTNVWKGVRMSTQHGIQNHYLQYVMDVSVLNSFQWGRSQGIRCCCSWYSYPWRHNTGRHTHPGHGSKQQLWSNSRRHRTMAYSTIHVAARMPGTLSLAVTRLMESVAKVRFSNLPINRSTYVVLLWECSVWCYVPSLLLLHSQVYVTQESFVVYVNVVSSRFRKNTVSLITKTRKLLKNS